LLTFIQWFFSKDFGKDVQTTSYLENDIRGRNYIEVQARNELDNQSL
jgi:hypothetical protein